MPSESPAVIIFDEDGNPIGAIQDGYDTIYRFQTESVIVGKDPQLGPNKEVTVIDDVNDVDTKRLQVEADIKPGASIEIAVPSPQDIVTDFLRDGGGSEDMLVNGSGTPVQFVFNADPVNDIIITEIRIVFTVTLMTFNGATFGKAGGSLTNGILFSGTINDGTSVNLINVLINEDWMRFATVAGLNILTEFSGVNDVLVSSYQFGGRTKLVGGSSDNITVTIRDDLTLAVRDIEYLSCTFYGYLDT